MYNILYGNAIKKDMDFEQVLSQDLKDGVMLGELIDMVETDKILSQNNAKTILFNIVDSKYPSSMSLT
jgi:hypothetical protein